MAKKLTLVVGQTVREVEVRDSEEGGLLVLLDGVEHSVELKRVGAGPLYELLLDHHATEVLLQREGPVVRTIVGADSFLVSKRQPGAGKLGEEAAQEGELNVSSPMTGVVVEVLVQAGDPVAKRDSLLVIQAMKMNNEIRSPTAGTIKAVHVSVDDTVDQGAPLLTIELGGGEGEPGGAG